MSTLDSKERLKERRAVIPGYLCQTHLVESTMEYQQNKYGIIIAFPSSDEKTCLAINKAMRTAFEKKHAKLCEDGTTITYDEVTLPLKEDDNFEGFYFMKAMTTKQPHPVDANIKPMELTTEPVWGSKACASVIFHATKIAGTPRIYAVLQNLQILSNKNHLEEITTFTPEEDFSKFSVEEEAEEND